MTWRFIPTTARAPAQVAALQPRVDPSGKTRSSPGVEHQVGTMSKNSGSSRRRGRRRATIALAERNRRARHQVPRIGSVRTRVGALHGRRKGGSRVRCSRWRGHSGSGACLQDSKLALGVVIGAEEEYGAAPVGGGEEFAGPVGTRLHGHEAGGDPEFPTTARGARTAAGTEPQHRGRGCAFEVARNHRSQPREWPISTGSPQVVGHRRSRRG